jgi:hypothetical protein
VGGGKDDQASPLTFSTCCQAGHMEAQSENRPLAFLATYQRWTSGGTNPDPEKVSAQRRKLRADTLANDGSAGPFSTFWILLMQGLVMALVMALRPVQ